MIRIRSISSALFGLTLVIMSSLACASTSYEELSTSDLWDTHKLEKYSVYDDHDKKSDKKYKFKKNDHPFSGLITTDLWRNNERKKHSDDSDREEKSDKKYGYTGTGYHDRDRTRDYDDYEHDHHHDYDSPSAVPVPASVWLLMSGLVGLVAVARRKNV